jgi:hypothetical protein
MSYSLKFTEDNKMVAELNEDASGNKKLNNNNPVIADIPRHKESNPRNYDKKTLARRRAELVAMGKVWPDVNPSWLELVWDFGENKTAQELEDIINSGVMELPSTKKRDVDGGVIKGAVNFREKTDEEKEWTRTEGMNLINMARNTDIECNKELEKLEIK